MLKILTLVFNAHPNSPILLICQKFFIYTQHSIPRLVSLPKEKGKYRSTHNTKIGKERKNSDRKNEEISE
jgi:hypothetical protein